VPLPRERTIQYEGCVWTSNSAALTLLGAGRLLLWLLWSTVNPWNESLRIVSNIDEDSLNVDQQLKVAQIHALLAIGQELSLIQDSGINPDWSQSDRIV
jgi:hypothetical protein